MTNQPRKSVRRVRSRNTETRSNSNLGPIRFWAEKDGKWHPVTPAVFSPTMKRSLPKEHLAMIRLAFRVGQHFSRNAIYRVYRRGDITPARYHQVREFIRAFIFTPREEGGKVIYRAPTVSEISHIFPEVGRSIANHANAVEEKRRARKKK